MTFGEMIVAAAAVFFLFACLLVLLNDVNIARKIFNIENNFS